jgi:organic radical activating enzyme
MTCEHCAFACTSKGVDIERHVAEKAIRLAEDVGDGITIGGGEPTLHPQFWNILAEAIYRLKDTEGECPFIVTNGKRTEDALALAWLADHNYISAYLSMDNFHDSIDNEVVEAFNPNKHCGNEGFRHLPKTRDMAFALGFDEVCWCIELQQQEDEAADEEDREPAEITPEDALADFWESIADEYSDQDISKGYWTVENVRARGRGKNVAGSDDSCACNGIMVASDGTVWQCGCKRLKLADDVWRDIYDLTPNHTECSESEYFQEALEMEEYA